MSLFQSHQCLSKTSFFDVSLKVIAAEISSLLPIMPQPSLTAAKISLQSQWLPQKPAFSSAIRDEGMRMGTEARSEELNTSDALRVLSETAGDQTRMSVFVCVLRKQDSSFESLKRQHILHPSQHQHSLPQLCSFRTLKSLLS